MKTFVVLVLLMFSMNAVAEEDICKRSAEASLITYKDFRDHTANIIEMPIDTIDYLLVREGIQYGMHAKSEQDAVSGAYRKCNRIRNQINIAF